MRRLRVRAALAFVGQVRRVGQVRQVGVRAALAIMGQVGQVGQVRRVGQVGQAIVRWLYFGNLSLIVR